MTCSAHLFSRSRPLSLLSLPFPIVQNGLLYLDTFIVLEDSDLESKIAVGSLFI